MGLERKERGFTLTELALALAILGLLFASLIRMSVTAQQEFRQKREYLNVYAFEKGLKTSFTSIVNAFESVCSRIPSDATPSWSWGWRHPSCNGTSPLPVFVGGERIRYFLNLNSVPSSASLVNQIASAYTPYCTLVARGSNFLDLLCPGLRGMAYVIGNSRVAQFHPPGTDLNSLVSPVVQIVVAREMVDGTVQNVTYQIDLADVWDARRRYSLAKLYTIRDALKRFHNQKLAREAGNTLPGGLSTADDELVPWFWQVFANTQANANLLCSRNTATGVCDNLNSSAVWSGVTDASAWRRIVQNVLNGEWKYTTDGFGNPLRIVPLKEACSGTNLNLCTSPTPPVPQDNYANVTAVLPPYTTVIYSRVAIAGTNCADLSTPAPDFCRLFIVY